MTENNTKTRNAVAGTEADQVTRALLVWLNQYPDIPVTAIQYEYLDAEDESMALSIIQGVYKTREYIDGTYEAECQFKLIYRSAPKNSNNQRLRMDEILNALGDWAAARRPYPQIGAGKRVRHIVVNSRASLFARYEDNSEDHQILMTMTYEVI